MACNKAGFMQGNSAQSLGTFMTAKGLIIKLLIVLLV